MVSGFTLNASPNDEQKPLVIILLGAPGSGKGTQATELAKSYSLPHISTGDLFRDNIKNGTPLGQKAKSFIDKGQLVPDSLVFDMLFDRLGKPDCQKGYILDGFPRNVSQAETLKGKLQDKVRLSIFNLKISDDEVIKRLTSRLTCKKCGHIFNTINTPPKTAGVCDVCGGELYQRPDDTEAVIRERLKVYHEQTQPVEDYYRGQKMLTDIDATVSPQATLKSIQDQIKK